MSTTTPTEFVGTPTLTDHKVAILKEWYVNILGDADKTDDINSSYYYGGMSDGFEDVLKLLYNMSHVVSEGAVEVVEKSRSFKKPLIILGIGVGIYALWNYESLKAKIQKENDWLRANIRDDANIKKIQDDHKED
jgi:hypothetical protein